MAPVVGCSQTKACFICGKTEPCKRVPMSSFKLKYSRSEILEKLGNVVGNNLLVVCCKGDVVCQHCVSIMEVIDKLEHELISSKRIILRLLENKYDLKNKYDPVEAKPEPVPAPVPVVERTESSFATRKRKSQETVDELTEKIEDDPRQRVWLECDKCHYTTNYTTFIDRHVRPVPCENCGKPMEDGLCSECPSMQQDDNTRNDSPNEEENYSTISPSSFLEDESVLGPIEEENPLETNQIVLPETVSDDEDSKNLTYLEFVDAPENEQQVNTEEFHVSTDLEGEAIWEDAS